MVIIIIGHRYSKSTFSANNVKSEGLKLTDSQRVTWTAFEHSQYYLKSEIADTFLTRKKCCEYISTWTRGCKIIQYMDKLLLHTLTIYIHNVSLQNMIMSGTTMSTSTKASSVGK